MVFDQQEDTGGVFGDGVVVNPSVCVAQVHCVGLRCYVLEIVASTVVFVLMQSA